MFFYNFLIKISQKIVWAKIFVWSLWCLFFSTWKELDSDLNSRRRAVQGQLYGKSKKRHERVRNNENGEKTKSLWFFTFFWKNIFPFDAYFFDLEGVGQWFELRKTSSSKSIKWKNIKRARNRVNGEKFQFLFGFFNFGDKIFFCPNKL